MSKKDENPTAPTSGNANTTTEEKASVNVFDAGDSFVAPEASVGTEMPPVPPEEDKTKGATKRGRPAGGKNKSKKKAPTVDENTQSIVSANIIVSCLDIVRKGVSNNECQPDPETREMTLAAWVAYLRENDYEVPAWVQVAVISCAYVAPAFHTETARGRVGKLWGKIKAWYVSRGSK